MPPSALLPPGPASRISRDSLHSRPARLPDPASPGEAGWPVRCRVQAAPSTRGFPMPRVSGPSSVTRLRDTGYGRPLTAACTAAALARHNPPGAE